METGNSLGCLQQREVVHTSFPACSVLLLCAAAGKSVGSCICRAEMSTADTNAWFNPLWCLGFALHVPGTNQWGVSKLPLTYSLLQDWCRCWVLSPGINAVKNKWNQGSEHNLSFKWSVWISLSRRYFEWGSFLSATHRRGATEGHPWEVSGLVRMVPAVPPSDTTFRCTLIGPYNNNKKNEGCPDMLECSCFCCCFCFFFFSFCLLHLYLSVAGSLLCMHMHAHTYPCSKRTEIHSSHKKKPFDHFSLTALHF